MANDDAFGIRGRARREDDLRDVITIDRHAGHRSVSVPVEVVERHVGVSVRRRWGRMIGTGGKIDVVADENQLRAHDAGDLGRKAADAR